MAASDVRVMIAVHYRVQSCEYLASRAYLANKAWAALRIAISHGFFLEAKTFPRWAPTDDMGIFSPIQEQFDITCDTCVCYYLKASPINDWVATDSELFITQEYRSPRLLLVLDSIIADEEVTSSLFWMGECHTLPRATEVHRSGLVSRIQGGLQAGFDQDLAFLVL